MTYMSKYIVIGFILDVLLMGIGHSFNLFTDICTIIYYSFKIFILYIGHASKNVFNI